MKRTRIWGWLVCLSAGCNAVAGTEPGRLPPTPPACDPGELRICYEGPENTRDVGVCRAGLAKCVANGSGFGTCEGSIQPTVELPNGLDDDCDGVTDDGITCEPGSVQACYSGPEGTVGLGICASGVQICEPDGLGYGPCIGEVLPDNEVGGDAVEDDDCNGVVDIACDPQTSRSCYSGPVETEGVGACRSGAEFCSADGQGFGECVLEVTPRVELCTTPLKDENCDGHSGCTGGHVWSKAFGDYAVYHDAGGMAVDSDGNALLIGYFQGSIDFGSGKLTSAGGWDVFVAKLDTSGHLIFGRAFGDAANEQYIRGVAADPNGNIIVTGYFDGTLDFGTGPMTSTGGLDVFVAKFDPSGRALWSKRFGDPNRQEGLTVNADNVGNVVIAGDFQGSVDFGGGVLTSAGGRDIYLAKFDPNGNHLWSKRFGGAGDDDGWEMAFTDEEHVILTGAIRSAVDFGGGLLANRGGADTYLAEFTAEGQHVWSHSYGGSSDEGGIAVALDSSGNIIVGGTINGAVDFGTGSLQSAGSEDGFVAKFSKVGTPLWSKAYGSAGPWETVSDLDVDPADNIVFVTGLHWGTEDYGAGPITSNGGRDVVTVKLDPSGNHLWSRRFGDNAIHQYAGGLAVDRLGNVIFDGYFSGTMDFGGGPLVAPSDTTGHKLYVAKLLP